MKEYLDFALEIAEFAKKEMLKHYGKRMRTGFKSDRTAITEVDKKINHYLIKKVKEKYPEHSVVGEEESARSNSSYVWVCDPVDGTGMYTDEVPVSVFSLALVVDGETVVGVVLDPFFNKTYTAIKGEGAFCNGEVMSVNKLHLGDLGYHVNYEMWHDSKYDTMKIVKDMLNVARISSIGSVARSCMAIASGHFCCDLFPGTEHGNCDIAASALIVSEAGGCVTDIFGNEQRYDRDIKGAIISNGVSHQEVLEYVKRYIKK